MGGITIHLTKHLRMHLPGQGYSLQHLIGKSIFYQRLTKMIKKIHVKIAIAKASN